MTRDETIQTLRKMAEWLEAHPDVPHPHTFSGFRVQLSLPGTLDDAELGLAALRLFDESEISMNPPEGRYVWARKEFGTPDAFASYGVEKKVVCKPITLLRESTEYVLLKQDAAIHDAQEREQHEEEASIGQRIDIKA